MCAERVHHINADEAFRDGMEPSIDDALLLYARLCLALFYEFVDVRYGDNDETFVVLHPGDSHLYINRVSFADPAVGQLGYPVFVQGFRKAFPVHRFRKRLPVLRIHIYPGFLRVAFVKILPPPYFGKRAGFFIRTVFDELARVRIDIVQICVALGQGLGNMGISGAETFRPAVGAHLLIVVSSGHIIPAPFQFFN